MDDREDVRSRGYGPRAAPRFLPASEGWRSIVPIGLCLALASGTPLAEDATVRPVPAQGDADDVCTLDVGSESGSEAAPEPDSEAVSGTDSGPSRGGMIPRDALVDMTRAQSGLLCSSEIFLGCMGFDGTMCRELSESAIERCLMTLPAEIDPSVLDNATLEACPRTVYEQAGYREDEASACLERALDES